KALIDKARAKGIPVIYTTGVRREDNWDSGSWTWKNGRSDEDMASKPSTNVDGNDIVAEIAPAPQDIVVLKQKPSGFFGTNMASYLTLLGCDSVIVTGTTTSGCVRATVLDAFSLNYRIALAEEGCFDRSQASHAINLCEMNAKYADVVKTSEVLAFFDSLPSGMFDLPKGSAPPAPKPRLAANMRMQARERAPRADHQLCESGTSCGANNPCAAASPHGTRNPTLRDRRPAPRRSPHVLDRYSALNGDFVLVWVCCHAALSPVAWTRASRSST